MFLVNPFRRRSRGRSRRRNPAATTWAAIAATGAALLGIAIGGVTYYRKKKRGVLPPGPTGPQQPSIPTPPAPPASQFQDGKFDYVGDLDPWVASDPRWTTNGRPNQQNIAQWMNTAGYSLGNWTASGFNFAESNQARAGVVRFQNDWNALVREDSQGTMPAWLLYVAGGNPNVQPPIGHLAEDGLIGPSTWSALHWVFTHNPGSWQGIVQAARAHPFS